MTDNDTRKQAEEAVNRRFNAMVRRAHDDYRRSLAVIEQRRRAALANVGKCAAFAEYMKERYGDKR